jgi:hypothetical protein
MWSRSVYEVDELAPMFRRFVCFVPALTHNQTDETGNSLSITTGGSITQGIESFARARDWEQHLAHRRAAMTS